MGAEKKAAKTTRSSSPAPKTSREGKGDSPPEKGKKEKGSKTKRDSSAKKAKKDEKGAEKAASADPAAEASSEAAGSAAEDEAQTKGRKRPKPETLKSITSGATAPIDFIEETPEDTPAPTKKEAKFAEEKPPEEATKVAPWQCIKWLGEIQGLLGCLSDALCLDGIENTLLEEDAALAHVRALEAKEQLTERLRQNGALEKLTEAIWPKVEILKAGPATASELAQQWKEEGAGDLLFGGLPAFFSGLEPRIGSPDPKVFKDMCADHCQKPDSQVEFTTGNYNVVTTSEVEWKFVVEPETPLKWPIEERLMGDESQKGHMRKLLPTEILMKRMEGQNIKLAALGADELTWNEVVGARLYTGPLFVKYNGVLRGLDSPVPFLKNAFIQLTCSKEIFEKFIGTSKPWVPANGSLPYDKAKKECNLYTTTIHVINSCIVKMGKLTQAKPVYRGMSLRILPEQFWNKNAQGVMGGVEYAFMSTTPKRSVAEQYSQDGYGIIVEIQQGMIDRGAEIAWLSQYPHEAEILFAPLAGLEAREMRIDSHPLNGKHIIVVSMRISINLTNPTIEQVVSKRRKICTDMGRGLLMEMRSALNKKGSNETDAYLRLMEGLMAERPLSHHAEWYNDDASFQEAVNETLRLKREVMNVPTLETKKLEGDAVAQLLGETTTTKPKVLVLPEIVFLEFNQLKVLNLDGFGGIQSLPKSMGGLHALHTLHMRECSELIEVPAAIGKLNNLSTLNMTYCKELKALPVQIGDLVALTSLDLAFCRALEKLPIEMGKLSQLQNLKLQQCSALTELPTQLGQCKELRKLSLYGCSALTSIPDSIGQLPELQELNMRVCSGLTHLPSTFGHHLHNLQTLDLTLCKGLTALPESIGGLQNLQTLFLGNCVNIPALPANIVNLSSLVTLNLYNCGGLTKLPENFNNLEALQVLSLQGCEKLVELPDALAMCPSLNTLTLWGCIVLTQMPDLTPLPKLQIDGVPEQLADWEAEQKRKRAEDMRDGKNKQNMGNAPKQASQWEAVKKDAGRGSVAANAVAALTTGDK